MRLVGQKQPVFEPLVFAWTFALAVAPWDGAADPAASAAVRDEALAALTG